MGKTEAMEALKKLGIETVDIDGVITQRCASDDLDKQHRALKRELKKLGYVASCGVQKIQTA